MTTSRRKICVFTATRAEYGLLMWLMRLLRDDPDICLQVLVSGAHLCPEFGHTVDAIVGDGFQVDARVDMVISNDTPVAVAKSMALGTIGFADALDRLRPDVLVLLGDRYETLAVAQAALLLGIPMAHVHGGEVTEGAMDESIRHAVSKMAHVHFAAAGDYARRLRQMGEDPEMVFDVGAAGIDNFRLLPLLKREEFENSTGFRLGARNVLVTYHPVTLSAQGPRPAFASLLAALDRFPDVRVILTKANSDTDGRVINQMIDEWATVRADRVLAVASLGQVRYLSAMKLVDAVVGNSSSGIIEAPAAGTPTVNIGDRQRGRLRAPSVVDCAETERAITDALALVLDPAFRRGVQCGQTPYGQGRAAERMHRLLKSLPLDLAPRKI